jgi:hypothetical protein
MYGIYLKCERCQATIGGEHVTPAQQGIPTLQRGEGRKLREEAAKRGWRFVPPDSDYCPACGQAEAHEQNRDSA